MAVVGFIGTGIMGAPMVKNLLKAGHQVQVWNRSSSKILPLVEAGAKACTHAEDAGLNADVLICMLTDGPACDEVLFGENAAVSSLKKNAIVIVMSSIPVQTAEQQNLNCLKLGLRYLDAPVSGGEKGAIEATLAIMVGGEQQTFDEAKPIFTAMGRATLVGAAGCGELAKLVNQLIVASTIATVSEGLLLAKQGGADVSKVREALSGGYADSPILQQHGLRIIEHNFKPGGKARIQLKDTHTAIAQAKHLNLTLPVGQLVDQLFEGMVDAGDGELDHAGLFRQIKRLNHLDN